MAYRYILESDSPVRFIVDTPTLPKSPVDPNVMTPPVVLPPIRPSFFWPLDITTWSPPIERYKIAYLIPNRREDDPTAHMYVYAAYAGNAIGSSHHNAGIIRGGRFEGDRLWAPYNAPEDMLWAAIEGRL